MPPLSIQLLHAISHKGATDKVVNRQLAVKQDFYSRLMANECRLRAILQGTLRGRMDDSGQTGQN